MTSRRVTMVLVLGTVVALMLAITGAASAHADPGQGGNPNPGDGTGGGNPDPTDPPGGGTGNERPPGGGGGKGGDNNGGNKDRDNDRGNDGFTLVTQQSSSGDDFDADFDVVEEAEDGDAFFFAPFLFFLFADDLCSPLNPEAVNELVPGCIFAE